MSDDLINYNNFQPDWWDAAGATIEAVKTEITRLVDSVFGSSSIPEIQKQAIELAATKHYEAQQAMKAAGEAAARAASYADVPDSPLFKDAVASRIAYENIAKNTVSEAGQLMRNAAADTALISKLTTVLNVLGPAINIAQLGTAAATGDAYVMSQKAVGVLAGMAFGALAVATVPASFGIAAVGIGTIALGFASGKVWEWMWENGAADYYGIKKGDVFSLSHTLESVDTLITDLQSSFHTAEVTTSPLILDLGNDGVQTIGKSAGIHFDHDGNRFAETTGWAGKEDGLLVWDKNGNGRIDNGGELFGNNTVLADGSKAANGFAALAELDSNHDGQVDASDAAFAQLRVWKDGDSNAAVADGELVTLQAAGVQSLQVAFTEQDQTDAQGNQHRQAGQYTDANGVAHAMTDVWFGADTARTIDQDVLAVDSTIAALPDLQGFGNVHSLHQAMAHDAGGRLQSLVNSFISENNADARAEIMTTRCMARTIKTTRCSDTQAMTTCMAATWPIRSMAAAVKTGFSATRAMTF